MNKSLLEQPTQDVEVQEDLTIEEITFSKLVAKGYTPTQAYRKAFDKAKNLAYGTVRNYASQLMTKNNILSEVATSKNTASRLARLAEDRIEQILIEDDSQRKGNKVADVAMFMYEQANGKAVQKTVVEGKHILVTYDLSGGQAGEVPKEVLDQLED
jgi:hypothetical protein